MSTKVIHSYDRGEGDEEYLFASTQDVTNPLVITDKNGLGLDVLYVGLLADYIDYLMPVDMANLKATTVQDRTFLINKEKTVSLSTRSTTSPIKEAFYWIKRASGDELHPFRYAVYLDGNLFQVVDEHSDDATIALTASINASYSYSAESKGNVVRIWKTGGSDFTFDSWDSWGDQASDGWKGSIGKLTDLPRTLGWTDKYVEITGDDNNEFTTYWVKSTEEAWIETRDPSDTRGTLLNMPLAIDRQADGTFKVSHLEWEEPKVGDIETNLSPSFIGSTLTDIFFIRID